MFTGFVEQERRRNRLEQRSQELGVRILRNVSGLTAMLVTDGSFAGGKLERARQLGTRILDPETYAMLLKHLQPAPAIGSGAKVTAAQTKATQAKARNSEPSGSASSPSEVRAWGIANGYAVGARGRLHSELVQAYKRAQLSSTTQARRDANGSLMTPIRDISVSLLRYRRTQRG